MDYLHGLKTLDQCMRLGDRMKEDRSWVAPLIFCTFGGVVIAAIFLFLRQQELMLTERGTAMAAWLTLVVTALAFIAALSAFFVAMKQMRDGQAQKNISIVNEIKDRLERLEIARETILKTRYIGSTIKNVIDGKIDTKISQKNLKTTLKQLISMRLIYTQKTITAIWKWKKII